MGGGRETCVFYPSKTRAIVPSMANPRTIADKGKGPSLREVAGLVARGAATWATLRPQGHHRALMHRAAPAGDQTSWVTMGTPAHKVMKMLGRTTWHTGTCPDRSPNLWGCRDRDLPPPRSRLRRPQLRRYSLVSCVAAASARISALSRPSRASSSRACRSCSSAATCASNHGVSVAGSCGCFAS